MFNAQIIINEAIAFGYNGDTRISAIRVGDKVFAAVEFMSWDFYMSIGAEAQRKFGDKPHSAKRGVIKLIEQAHSDTGFYDDEDPILDALKAL